MRFCSFCGALPGTASKCPARRDGHPAHNFVFGPDNTFCSLCGERPGNPSRCYNRRDTDYWHEFKTMQEYVFFSF